MTHFEEFVFERGRLGDCFAAVAALHDDISDHDCAGDRTFSSSYERHPHAWMAIEYRLDLFGMNFGAADVNYSIPPANEVIAFTV